MLNNRTVVTAVLILLLTGVLIILPTSHVIASEAPTPDDVKNALSGGSTYQPLSDAANVQPSPNSEVALGFSTETVDTTVPRSADKSIQISAKNGEVIGVRLPYANDSSVAESISEGAVAYPNAKGFTSAPIVKSDGSVQIATVVGSSEAPELYPYSLEIPEDATVKVTEDGGVVITGGDGRFIGGLTPPWARDANGVTVETKYEISEGSVTQVVNHRKADVTYPVVADPWLGVEFFGQTWENRNGPEVGQPVISARLTNWALYWYLNSTPLNPVVPPIQPLLYTQGWDELVRKQPKSDDKPTIRQQYECHVLYGQAVWAAGVHWDLEMFRPNNPEWILQNPMAHKCNWDTADGRRLPAQIG